MLVSSDNVGIKGGCSNSYSGNKDFSINEPEEEEIKS